MNNTIMIYELELVIKQLIVLYRHETDDRFITKATLKQQIEALQDIVNKLKEVQNEQK